MGTRGEEVASDPTAYMPIKMAAARLVVRNLTPVDKAFSL
jgi:hypothetical protein